MEPFFRNILVPIDFSPRASVALRYAVDLARACGGTATIELLHVVSTPGLLRQAAEHFVERTPGPTVESEVASARRMIELIVESVPHQGIRIGTRVEAGHAAPVIERVAAEEKSDLIVLCTHGRYGLAGVVFGSVAKAIVATAPCPLTILRVDALSPSDADSPTQR